MAYGRTERLVNLALCLMSSEYRIWTADEIRQTVPGYDHPATSKGEAAFRRAFERDKDELRSLGFPLELLEHPSGVEGYRIRRSEAFLPEVSLDAEEARAVALAVRMWRSGTLEHAAAHAWNKLHAAGVEPGEHVGTDGSNASVGSDGGAEGPFDEVPAVDTGEPAFDPLLGALSDAAPVGFDYRRRGQAQPQARAVEPWGLRAARGRWYLVGFDRDRAASRVFRLSRIVGPVRRVGPDGSVRRPDGVDLQVEVDQAVGTPVRVATVRLRKGRANEVRRLVRPEIGGPAPNESAPAKVSDPGTETVFDREFDPDSDREFDVVGLPFSDVTRAAALLAAHGPDAVVLDPVELREEVVGLLTAQAMMVQPS